MANIYVYDNNSSDCAAQVAAKAGAFVGHEHYQGKGNVIRRMFADIEADTYVLVDGDSTYDAASLPTLLDVYSKMRVDMVHAARITTEQDAYRVGHRFGNWMLTYLVTAIFGRQFKDILSGLPGIFATLCQVVPGAPQRLRDRNRTDHSCA